MNKESIIRQCIETGTCKIDGYDWSLFLGEYPQFFNFCDRMKLNGSAWSYLLAKQPQFAQYCDWSKLNDDDWYWLLKKQPQFILHREGT